MYVYLEERKGADPLLHHQDLSCFVHHHPSNPYLFIVQRVCEREGGRGGAGREGGREGGRERERARTRERERERQKERGREKNRGLAGFGVGIRVRSTWGKA